MMEMMEIGGGRGGEGRGEGGDDGGKRGLVGRKW